MIDGRKWKERGSSSDVQWKTVPLMSGCSCSWWWTAGCIKRKQTCMCVCECAQQLKR